MSNPVHPQYYMAKSCDSIEFLDHSLIYECHTKRKINFNIIKFNNVKLGNNPNAKDLYIDAKRFAIFPDMPYYHLISDKLSQFEIINDYDNEILPIFLTDACNEENPGLVGFYKDIYDLYKISFPEMQALISTQYYNVIIKELYLIVDELRIVPKQLYLDVKSSIPEWYDETKNINPFLNTNCAGSFYMPFTDNDFKNAELFYKIDDLLRIGIDLVKKRILPHIPVKEKTYGIYISRLSVNNSHKQKYDDLVKDWEIKYPGESVEQIFANRFSNDPQISQILMNSKRYTEREDWFIDKISALGFEIVYMEDLSFIEQMSKVLNTKRIMSMTGSSMVNAFIADPDTKIYEICEPINAKFNFFWYFSPIRCCSFRKMSPVPCVEEQKWFRISERRWEHEAIREFKLIDNDYFFYKTIYENFHGESYKTSLEF